MERNGNKPMRSAGDVAILLAKIARYWVKAPTEHVALINRYARNVMPRGEGLGRKNRLRLAPLRDPKNLCVSFYSQGKFARRSSEIRASSRDALLMQRAVALLILTYAPLRIGNLSALHLERHLRCTGPNMSGSLCSTLTAPKSRTARRFPSLCHRTAPIPFGSTSATTIRAPTSGPNPYLFPSDLPGRPKRSDTLGKQLTRLIHRTIGLQVNPHLYRHLVHLIVLNRYPGAYAMVSRVLGHKSLQTAISNYAGEDIAIAMRTFQRLVADVVSGGRLVRHDGPAAFLSAKRQELLNHGPISSPDDGLPAPRGLAGIAPGGLASGQP